MARSTYVIELPADAVQLMYSGVELFVTPRGDVFRMGRKNQWLRCAWIHNGKYGHAQITVKTKQIYAFVHRLVALAFIPNPDNHLFVCHKSEALNSDGFLDNSVENLWWGSHSDNINDKIQKGRQPKGSNHVNSKLSETDIPKIRQLYATGKSQKVIAEIYGVYPQIISSIVNNKIWKHV